MYVEIGVVSGIRRISWCVFYSIFVLCVFRFTGPYFCGELGWVSAFIFFNFSFPLPRLHDYFWWMKVRRCLQSYLSSLLLLFTWRARNDWGGGYFTSLFTTSDHPLRQSTVTVPGCFVTLLAAVGILSAAGSIDTFAWVFFEHWRAICPCWLQVQQ